MFMSTLLSMLMTQYILYWFLKLKFFLSNVRHHVRCWRWQSLLRSLQLTIPGTWTPSLHLSGSLEITSVRRYVDVITHDALWYFLLRRQLSITLRNWELIIIFCFGWHFLSIAIMWNSIQVWYRVIQIVINRDDIQGYAAKTVFEALQSPSCHENMVKVGGYILGEFGNLIAGDPRSR